MRFVINLDFSLASRDFKDAMRLEIDAALSHLTQAHETDTECNGLFIGPIGDHKELHCQTVKFVDPDNIQYDLDAMASSFNSSMTARADEAGIPTGGELVASVKKTGSGVIANINFIPARHL